MLGAHIMIDGSYEEGGGQIIRTALALSTITGKPFEVNNIRAGRDKPGLKAQHMACIEALEELSSGKATDAYVGSPAIKYRPGRIKGQTLPVDIGTAGSITLFMQALLLPCCLAEEKVRLKIKGGTDVKWAMPVDYYLNVVMPHFSSLADIKVNKIVRGFYPKGQGLLDITIRPKSKSMRPLDLTKKKAPAKIKGVSFASSDLRTADVAARQAKGAKKKLSSLGVPVKIAEEYAQTESVGTVITLWTDNMGSDALGQVRKRAEAVGAEAGAELLFLLCSDAVVDCHLADNLVPLLGLFSGKILTDEITGHIKSNVYVAENFLEKKIKIEGNLILT